MGDKGQGFKFSLKLFYQLPIFNFEVRYSHKFPRIMRNKYRIMNRLKLNSCVVKRMSIFIGVCGEAVDAF